MLEVARRIAATRSARLHRSQDVDDIAVRLEAEGFLVISCGRSRVKLPTRKSEDFLMWSTAEPVVSFSISGDDLHRAFGRVRYAVGTDELRYYLQGVHLDAHDGKLHFVATDGHRLAVSGMAAPAGAEACPKVVLPAETVDAAATVFKGIPDIAVAISKTTVSFSADGLRLCCKLIDGTYPDYQRVIPARGAPRMVLKRADFADGMTRAGVLTGKGAFSAIVARPDVEGGALRLEARNDTGGEAVEEMAATVEEGFRPFGFNPRYAVQFIANLGVGDLTFEQRDPDGPHLLYSDDAPDFLGVLMPMRVFAA